MLCALIRRAALAAFVMMLMPTCGFAQDLHWINASGGSWNVAANWDLSAVPASGDNVFIDASGTYTVTLSGGTVVANMNVGGGTGVQTLAVVDNILLVSLNTYVYPNGVLSFVGGTMILSGPGCGLLNDGTVVLAAPTAIVEDDANLWNNGTIDLQSDIQILDPGNSFGFINNEPTGTLLKSTGAGSAWISCAFNDQGAITVQSGTLAFLENVTHDTGIIEVDNSCSLSCPQLTISSGSLIGEGIIDGDVINQGTVAPGVSGIGTLSVTGAFQQGPSGTLSIELTDVANFDRLSVGSAVSLDGVLDVALLGSLSAGDSFTVMDYASVAGDFASFPNHSFGPLRLTRDFSSFVSLSLVSEVNAPPIAVDGVISTLHDQSVSGSLTASDFEGDALTYSLVTQPTLGSVTLDNAATGDFTYTPLPGFTGVETFTFQVFDGTDASVVDGIETVGVDASPTLGAGGALSFAPGDHVTVPHQAALTPASMTIEAWVKFLTPLDDESMLVAGSGDASTAGYLLRISDDGSGNKSVEWWSNGAFYVEFTTIPVGRWLHLAVVQTASVTEVYIDGNLVGSSALPPPIDAGLPFEIGSATSSCSYIIDEVRLWNVALTGPQIMGFASASQATPDPNLVSVWHLDELAGPLAIDSASGFTGTYTGSPSPIGDVGVLTPGSITVSGSSSQDGTGLLAVADVDGPSRTFNVVSGPTYGTVSVDDATGFFTYSYSPFVIIGEGTDSPGFAAPSLRRSFLPIETSITSDSFDVYVFDGMDYSNTITVNIAIAQVTVVESGGTTDVGEGGPVDTITVALSTAPSMDVTVALAPDAFLNVSSPSLVFTSANWSTPQAVTVMAVDDSLPQGTHSGSLTFTATSADPVFNGIPITPLSVTITDNDTAATVGWVAPTGIFYEGLPMKVAFQVSPPAPAGGLSVLLGITAGSATNSGGETVLDLGDDFSLSSISVNVPGGASIGYVTVNPADDGVFEPIDETFTLALLSGGSVAVDSSRATFDGTIVDHEPLVVDALVAGSPVGTSIAVSIGQVIEFDLHDGLPVLGTNGAPTFIYATPAPEGSFTFFTTDLALTDADGDLDNDPTQKAVVCALKPGTYTVTVGDGASTTDYTVTAADLAPIVVVPPILPGSTAEVTSYSAIGANTPTGLANLLATAGTYSDEQASAYVWDATSQGYVRLPNLPSGGLTPGEAIFLASRVDFGLDFDGVPLPMFFEVTLHPGWNFISIPSLGDGTTTFDTHAWNDLRVFDSTTNAELVSTERDAAIGVSAFLWDPLAGAYASVTSFDAGKGYWIRDNLASDLHIVRFPTLSLGNLNGFAASHQSRLYHGETPVKSASHRRQFAAGGPPLPPGGLNHQAASGNGCGVGSGAAGIVLLLAMGGFAALSRRRFVG